MALIFDRLKSLAIDGILFICVIYKLDNHDSQNEFNENVHVHEILAAPNNSIKLIRTIFTFAV